MPVANPGRGYSTSLLAVASVSRPIADRLTFLRVKKVKVKNFEMGCQLCKCIQLLGGGASLLELPSVFCPWTPFGLRPEASSSSTDNLWFSSDGCYMYVFISSRPISFAVNTNKRRFDAKMRDCKTENTIIRPKKTKVNTCTSLYWLLMLL